MRRENTYVRGSSSSLSLSTIVSPLTSATVAVSVPSGFSACTVGCVVAVSICANNRPNKETQKTDPIWT